MATASMMRSAAAQMSAQAPQLRQTAMRHVMGALAPAPARGVSSVSQLAKASRSGFMGKSSSLGTYPLKISHSNSRFSIQL